MIPGITDPVGWRMAGGLPRGLQRYQHSSPPEVAVSHASRNSPLGQPTDDGAVVTEYAILLMLVALAMIALVAAVGLGVRPLFLGALAGL